MPDSRKNLIPRNEGFVCDSCGHLNPPAPKTSRNHCRVCLTSKHVDNTPGDRANACRGLMPAISVEGTDPDHLDLIHRCQTCQKTQRNRTAPDDDKEAIFSLMRA